MGADRERPSASAGGTRFAVGWWVEKRGGRMGVPEDLRYTSDHEWVRRSGDRFTVGITAFAQEALGDIVFVGRPDLESVVAGAACGEIESTKSVSEVYAPLGGTVVAANDLLEEHP